MAETSEMRVKEKRVRDLMEKESLDALAISSVANFAWLTCGGRNFVGTASEFGVAVALITRDAKYLVCDNIDASRILEEEVAGQGFEAATFYWYEGVRDRIIRDIVGDGVLGSDVDMAGAKNVAVALDSCRRSLTPEEIGRYEWLGEQTGECLMQACLEIEPGMTEDQIGAVLNECLVGRGIVPGLTLVAADERIEKYRHPLPTANKLRRVAMLVTSARKWGLIISASRLVHFRPLPSELRRKHDAVTRVDAEFITATRVGTKISDIFRRGIDMYEQTGFGEQWKSHHQGGPTGYKPREFRATLQTDAAVVENQAFAWNPSITGTKSEDTIIATADGPKILSAIENWPEVEVATCGGIRRPDILVR